MGISEVIFVGGFSVICVGTSAVVCILAIDLKERLNQSKSEVLHWKTQADDEKVLRHKWQTQSNRWKDLFNREKANTLILKRQVAELQRSRYTQQTASGGIATEDKVVLVRALKKAMFEAHPDRGGNNEEFIEYNKLYKKLK